MDMKIGLYVHQQSQEPPYLFEQIHCREGFNSSNEARIEARNFKGRNVIALVVENAQVEVIGDEDTKMRYHNLQDQRRRGPRAA